MIQVMIKLVHSLMSVGYLILSLYFLLSYCYLNMVSSTISGSHSLFSYPQFSFLLELDFSPSSMVFMALVSLITSVVIIFSYSYMGSHCHSLMFMVMLHLFVLSMMLVISFKNLFMVMLGWDGLGVISFFLILYYQSPASIFSAWFTILMNRLGDGFLILSIVFMLFTDLSSLSFVSYYNSYPNLLVLILVLGLMTKSAIYPFSPWLPVAMSAPTPISSLVHSSTLVTSGLYLMMRLESFIFSSPQVVEMLMWVSLFTSLYAGLSALMETDLKKLVALSTLSHLGFIGMSFSMGFTSLAFFHLLAHALFKSLLFMGVGDWISLGHHYQDSRALSAGFSLSPLSALIIMSSCLSLLGIPFMVGFYSKDMVLESLFYSSYSHFYLMLVYFNVFLTFMYTLRVVKYSLSFITQSSPYLLTSHLSSHHYAMMFILSTMSLLFPVIYVQGLDLPVLVSIPAFHFLPLVILSISLGVLFYQFTMYKFYSAGFPYSLVFMTQFAFTYMLNMGSLYPSAVGKLAVTSMVIINKTFELGSFNALSQTFLISASNSGSMFLKYSVVLVPISLVLYFLFMI